MMFLFAAEQASMFEAAHSVMARAAREVRKAAAGAALFRETFGVYSRVRSTLI